MSYENKIFFVVGAGELQIPLINAAKSLGLRVLASDQNPQAPGFSIADFHIIANTLDPSETYHQLKIFIEQYGDIHGVATAGTDASYTVAVIANEFGLPGHTPDAAFQASNKAAMRDTFKKFNVSIPAFQKISSLEEAEDFFIKINKPCVLKPIDNMGARGTSLVRHQKELAEAFDLTKKNSKNAEEYLIEEYIDAHELSIDALVHDGKVTITGIADRIIEYTPYFVETGHIMPSALPDDWIQRAIYTFRDGIAALGLSHGAAKGDIKISEQGSWVIEIAGRLSGGFMSSHTFPLATGIHLHEYMVRLALGEKIETITPTKNNVSIERAIIATPGKITRIEIPSDLSNQKYIKHYSIRSKVGDIIISPKNNIDKSGNIIACAPTRELAIQAINKALLNINIVTEPQEDFIDIIKKSEEHARSRLTSCVVCRACNGIACRGKIPGVGGIGTGEGFIQAYEKFRTIKLLPSYIHDVREVDTSIEMFGQKLSMPIFTAPIAGSYINYDNVISELEFQRAFMKGAMLAGTMAFLSDPAPQEFFNDILRVILENFGKGILICKPRVDQDNIKERYHKGINNGILGLGTDIDGIGIPTLKIANQLTTPKNIQELKELRTLYHVPFVVKGVLTPQDAERAIEAGATHIVVSSHGGRINESFPLPIDMLPEIAKVAHGHVHILIDGAIRSGADIAKALILGADAVLIGRPVAIHAIGGGACAVWAYLASIQEDLAKVMLLLGKKSIDELKGQKDLIRYTI
ncbi:MAG: alpha-hydroxy-acid oxidizing protein [Brevinema sp.]